MTDTQALSERLMGALIGAAELCTVELGRELGLYAALRDGPMTSAELAKAAGVDERYAREWLAQQAAAGFLTAAGDDGFALTAGIGPVLLDEGGPDYFGTAGEFALGIALATPRVIEAFRTGAGVPYADYGRHIRHGIAAFNRPMFDHRCWPCSPCTPGDRSPSPRWSTPCGRTAPRRRPATACSRTWPGCARPSARPG